MSCMLRLLRRALTALTHTPDPSALTHPDGGAGDFYRPCHWPVTPPNGNCGADAIAVVERYGYTPGAHRPRRYVLPVCRTHHQHAQRTGWTTLELIDHADGQPLPEIDPTSYSPHATPLEHP